MRRSSHRRPRYAYRTVRIGRRKTTSVINEWQANGWEVLPDSQREGRFRTQLRFYRVKPRSHPTTWAVGLAVIITLAVGAVLVVKPVLTEPTTRAQANANAAIMALNDGNLTALEKRLSTNRGNREFAYWFAKQTTPRTLGDALATVANGDGKASLNTKLNSSAYALTLTDLAGAVALATQATGARKLPSSWANSFVKATTSPTDLYGSVGDKPGQESQQRADQDQANKQNLLLLLSRGDWSISFLQRVTSAYWDFDHTEREQAWPGTTLSDAKYAPAPNGRYLTDGTLALTAALTANPRASAWAFTDFQPGTETVEYADGTKHSVGKFTHYLFMDHKFPGGSDAGSVGMTASLTALSAAIDVTDPANENVADNRPGSPHADSLVLQAMAKSAAAPHGHDSILSKALHTVEHVAEAAWHWVVGVVQRWGHTALGILSFATMIPPPFDAVGIPVGATAAATNATWYAIDGDYAEAGLSLAAAVPGLAFGKFVKAGKAAVADAKAGVDLGEAGVTAVESGVASAKLGKIATTWRWIKTPSARLGTSTTNAYRRTFFAAHPDLDPAQVIVHHAVEQSARFRYPGRFTESEIHSLENLRGIPKDLNTTLHLSDIKRLWDEFYRTHPAETTTRAEILKFATKVDRLLGYSFVPPIG